VVKSDRLDALDIWPARKSPLCKANMGAADGKMAMTSMLHGADRPAAVLGRRLRMTISPRVEDRDAAAEQADQDDLAAREDFPRLPRPLAIARDAELVGEAGIAAFLI